VPYLELASKSVGRQNSTHLQSKKLFSATLRGFQFLLLRTAAISPDEIESLFTTLKFSAVLTNFLTQHFSALHLPSLLVLKGPQSRSLALQAAPCAC
jgi:hypothetical protein